MAYIAVGLIAGIVGGFFGIGGATIMIPVLVYFFGMTQHQAQGISLAAILPPVGLLAVWQYYKAGNVDIKIASLIALGFFAGGFFGGKFVQPVDSVLLKKLFGIFLAVIGIKMAFFS